MAGSGEVGMYFWVADSVRISGLLGCNTVYLVNDYQRFGLTCSHHIQGKKGRFLES